MHVGVSVGAAAQEDWQMLVRYLLWLPMDAVHDVLARSQIPI